MEIYFSGSINGGREKQETYYELISYCKNFGHVLTENIGNEDTEVPNEEKKYSDRFDEHIYLRDTDWVRKSDILIADVTVPSLGVGYEIAYAENLNKKILCLFDISAEKKVSFMLSGNVNLLVKGYTNIEEAKEMIKEFIDKEGYATV